MTDTLWCQVAILWVAIIVGLAACPFLGDRAKAEADRKAAAERKATDSE